MSDETTPSVNPGVTPKVDDARGREGHETVIPTPPVVEQSGDWDNEDAPQPVDDGQPKPSVVFKYPQAARGQMATRFLESADRLGLDRSVVRSITGGFRVPHSIAADLFPSQFGE
jgi:hypothetical protein